MKQTLDGFHVTLAAVTPKFYIDDDKTFCFLSCNAFCALYKTVHFVLLLCFVLFN